jgi:hypothetical protein
MDSSAAIIATCAALSLVAAAVYAVLVEVNLWQTTAYIFALAGAFYTYVIARFEAPNNEVDHAG